VRWASLSGKLFWHPDRKYRIDWERKAPSKGAQKVKDWLKENCNDLIWFEEYRVPTTRLRVDFLSPNKKIAIEFNGRQHDDFVEFFQKTRLGLLKQVKNDLKKRDILEKNGYTLIEIYEVDLPISRKFFEERFGVFL